MNTSYTLTQKWLHRFGVSSMCIMWILACASIPAPTEQMAVSKEAVNAATSAGANEAAPVQLKSAMDKMEEAERAMQAEDYVLARRLAEQAQVDAQLAESKARSAEAQKAAGAVQESHQILRQELNRKIQ